MPIDPLVHAVILAGGSGSRLWPLSRSLFPKHLLPFQGEETLLQQTARRVLRFLPPSNIVTVTQESLECETHHQLSRLHPEVGSGILSEPKANNTLPAIAWAVGKIARKNPRAFILVLPSDHLIRNDDSFERDVHLAWKATADGALVTFGIPPTRPETGYGYIQAGSLHPSGTFHVVSFIEKPDRKTAERLLREGNHFWNSGIFAFRADAFQEALRLLQPSVFQSVQRIVSSSDGSETLRKEYATMPAISIDYGLMEKVHNLAVVPATFGWNDLGSWEAIHEEKPKDDHGNVVEGDVLTRDVDNSLILSKKGCTAAIGLKDIAIIQTGDAVLVSPRSRVQEVKQIVEELKVRGSKLAEEHASATRPWGCYSILEEGDGYKIKKIVVDPGQKLSLQRHQHRTEHWVVIQGIAKVTRGSEQFSLKENESTFIAIGEIHRLENPESVPLIVIEVQTGHYLKEDDIERFDDAYGRVVC